MKSLILRGLVVDPANKIHSRQNVLLENGKIAAVFDGAPTEAQLAGAEVIEADGLVVTPGFVDVHMHEDPYDEAEDRFRLDIFDCMLRMGVTTAVAGNCGEGPADPALYLDAADRLGLPVNLALLLPHESLRKAAGVTDKYAAASDGQIRIMEKMTGKWLDAGCAGLSYGIRYVPGLDSREMRGVNAEVGRTGKLIAAHVRDDEAKVVPAVIEFLDNAQGFGSPLQVSHIGSMGAFGYMADMLSTVDGYRLRGADVACDCYPYTAFCTSIGSTTFDEGFHLRYGGRYDCVEAAQGKYRGQRLTEEIYRYYRAEDPKAYMIAYVMRQDEVDMALTHPNVVMASDGTLHSGEGHPRAAGAFPRFLRMYVYERQLMSLSEAVAKITCLPAARVGLDRGTLSPGRPGDVTIFDPGALTDKATFAQPTLAPEGITHVFLGGVLAARDGQALRRDLGRTLRK